MKLSEIYRYFKAECQDEREVTKLSLNSENADAETLFIALKGLKHDGKEYIEDCYKRGVPSAVSESYTKLGLHVPALRNCLTPFSLYFYGNPDKNLKLIGVTGTEGKSTTAYLIHAILRALEVRSLLITTTEGISDSFVTANTTPFGPELAKILKQAVEGGYTHVVMECSSIGIANHKLTGLKFDVGVLTNLRTDHLDFHKSKHDYHQTKLDFLRHQVTKVVAFKRTAFFHRSLQSPRVKRIRRSDYTFSKMSPVITFLYHDVFFKTRFQFRYNLDNILLAVEAVHQLNFSYRSIAAALCAIEPLPGRAMKVYDDPPIFIDYAHTASAFAASVKALKRAYPSQKLILVFGAGGEREKGKRAKYGSTARKYAYLSFITEDNNRSEPFNEIAAMIMGRHKDDFIVIQDRRKAIKYALAFRDESVIAIIGKGAEQTMIVDGVEVPYSDEEEVKRWLKNS